MSRTITQQSRRYDHMYDPMYTSAEAGAVAPAGTAQGARADVGAVSGVNRYKYFKRPAVPFMHNVPPEVLLAPTSKADPATSADDATAPGVEALTKTVGTQSKYRESEAQTLPYTPDYTVRPGDEPEILTLAALSHGKGLPASKAEVEMIERARQKREFEASLPPITDEASFELRQRMMREQEEREMAFRVAEIDQLQAERLALLQAAIVERDQENAFLSEQRVEALRQRKLDEKDKAVAEIQQRRIKQLRKLAKKRALVAPRVHGENRGRDIVAEYADASSEIYAPSTRKGQNRTLDKHGDRFEVRQSDLTNTLPGLNFLQASLPRRMLATDVAAAKAGKGGSGGAAKTAEARREVELAGQLQMADDLIKTQKLEAAAAATGGPVGAGASMAEGKPGWGGAAGGGAAKAEKPSTPRVEDTSEAEARLRSLSLLTRLLRGRAAQNAMFEGKERRAALIAELRESDEAQPPPALAAQEDELRAKAERGIAVLDGALDTAQGETVSATLDMLAKELVRKEEQERISAMAGGAGDERRVREAEEGGRRQAEDALRSREDQMYEQVVRTHQGAADSYVDELMAGQVDELAHEQAVSEHSSRPSTAASDGGRSELGGGFGGESEDGEEVKELVASFLLPEVERQRVRQQVQQEERRFVDAAHGTIAGAVGQGEAEQEAKE